MSTGKLTAQVKAGGCASKLAPKLLDRALAGLPRFQNPNVLAGFDGAEDAGVYRLTPDCAIVQTVDFFTPVVDDPYTFGAIAAANALSDIYAMGGTPISALSVLAYPPGGDMDDLHQILRGGADKLAEANCVLLGGHSVSDPEVKCGYAVTGTVHPDRVLYNRTARPGDILVLTKSIGIGVISTALKRGLASEEHEAAAIASMLKLNRDAADALQHVEAHGCTDVTGFGLLGHSREMAMASGVTLEIDASLLRLLPGALEYSEAGAHSGGLHNNREFAGSCVAFKRTLAPALEALLYDPQTSGGLLISMAPADFPLGYQIGRVLPRGDKPILVI